MEDPEIYAKDKVRFELMRTIGLVRQRVRASIMPNTRPIFCGAMIRSRSIDVPVDEYVRRSIRNLNRYKETRRKLLAGEPFPNRA